MPVIKNPDGTCSWSHHEKYIRNKYLVVNHTRKEMDIAPIDTPPEDLAEFLKNKNNIPCDWEDTDVIVLWYEKTHWDEINKCVMKEGYYSHHTIDDFKNFI